MLQWGIPFLLLTTFLFVTFVFPNFSAKQRDDSLADDAPMTQQPFESGEYEVGKTVAPGEYAIHLNKYGHYEVTSNRSFTSDSIIFNYTATEPMTVYVQLEEQEFVRLTDASAQPIENATPQRPVDERFGSGMYKVGFDVKEGTYTIYAPPNDDLGYVEIRTNARGDVDGLVTGDYVTSDRTIDVTNGQYILLNNAQMSALPIDEKDATS